MSQTIRVSLPGYNALTDSNIDHYALYADSDNILIKEFARGTTTLDNNETATIAHNLGYSPHCFAYGETATAGRFQIIVGFNIYGGVWRMYVDGTNLKITNNTGNNDKEARYFIFYDNID